MRNNGTRIKWTRGERERNREREMYERERVRQIMCERNLNRMSVCERKEI